MRQLFQTLGPIGSQMKFQLDKFHRNISDEDLLQDLRKAHDTVVAINGTLSFRSYNEAGKYTSSTIATRFGTWNKALKKAGLEINEEKNINERNLFLNLENVWVSLGRQPVTRDLAKPLSKYTHHAYNEHFGGFRKALEAFVKYINEEDTEVEIIEEQAETISTTKNKTKRRTSRNISDRMRFRILSRDGFTCQSCGASPIKERGVELHVDHITPWSKGGETEEENLQTKCKQCNLGKGNAFDK